MIAGEMPRWHQRVHFFSCGLMCLLFAALGILGGGVFIAGLFGLGGNATPPTLIPVGVLVAAFALAAIVGQVRGLGRLVREYCYDGGVLQFRTLRSPQEEVRQLSEIVEVRECSARGPSPFYCLGFRDGKKVYLEYGLSNVAALVAALRLDLTLLSGQSASQGAGE
jgi:hypothetical protein